MQEHLSLPALSPGFWTYDITGNNDIRIYGDSMRVIVTHNRYQYSGGEVVDYYRGDASMEL